MATLRALASRLNKLADTGLEERAAEYRARVALAIIRALIDNTPVDTTAALSNWRVSDGPLAAAIAAHVPGEKGSTRGASAAVALAEAQRAIEAGKHARALVIFNTIPYIRYLNEGSSSQAPAGFIEKAILAGRLAARQ
jgi:hypothetical protein